MAHQVETMAYAGELPWHGLGVKVEETLTPEQILIEAGLDWTVSKRPLQYPSLHVGAEEYCDATDQFALVRDSDNQFLDVVGKTYQPTQNRDAFDFFDQFVKETKLRMHTAGSLCEGKFVWALAATDKSFEIGPQNDKVDSYILLVSPHQFGKALIAQQTTVRVVCANTLALALGQKSNPSYRMPHSRVFDAAAKTEAAKLLDLTNANFVEFKAQSEALAGHALSHVQADDFFHELLKIEQEVANTNDGLVAANDGGYGKSRRFDQFLEAFEGNSPGAELSGTKGTLWGAVNAVTYVVDHVSVRNRERAFRDSLFGYRGEMKRRALTQALKWAA